MNITRHKVPLPINEMLEEEQAEFSASMANVARIKRFGGFQDYASSIAARLVCLGQVGPELCKTLNIRSRIVWAMCATVENGGYEADFGFGTTRVLPKLHQGEIPTPRTWTPGFASAVLTYDSYIIENLAKHPRRLMKPTRGRVDPLAFHYVEAWQAYLLGDREQAYEAASETLATDAIVNEDYALGVLYPRAELFCRLIEGDEKVFNKRLTYVLEAHKEYFSKGDRVYDTNGHFPVEVVAIANLAHDVGMDVTVESDYLPMALVRGLCKSGW